MKTYRVRVERAGGWWAIDVPEIEGVFSQARRLDKAEAMARDAIATMLDVPADSFHVDMVLELGDDVAVWLHELEEVRGRAECAQRVAAAKQAEVAGLLVHKAHLSMRDAGRIMGVSHQRIDQLVD